MKNPNYPIYLLIGHFYLFNQDQTSKLFSSLTTKQNIFFSKQHFENYYLCISKFIFW